MKFRCFIAYLRFNDFGVDDIKLAMFDLSEKEIKLAGFKVNELIKILNLSGLPKLYNSPCHRICLSLILSFAYLCIWHTHFTFKLRHKGCPVS